MTKALIVNPFGIGDVLFTFPLIAALKAGGADVSLSYVGNARTAPLLANDPRIDKVFSYERDEFVAVYRHSPWRFLLKWRAFTDDIRREKFDVAYDLSMGSPVGIALMLAGIPRRIGFDYKGRGRWLTHKMPFQGYEGRHVAEYILGLAPAPVAEDGPDPVIRLSIPAQDQAWATAFMSGQGLEERSFIVVCPGGGASWGKGARLKRWPVEQYAHLVEKIIERSKHPIILMGDQSEAGLCGRVAGRYQGRVITLAGQTSLLQAAAFMQRARFVLVNDGGPLHIAVASGARTVSVFGPVDPAVYGPYPSVGHKIVIKGLPCQPCYRRFRMPACGHGACLNSLTVDEVFGALEEWL